MFRPISYTLLISMLRRRPTAIGSLRGGQSHQGVRGEVLFYDLPMGVFMVVDVAGLLKDTQRDYTLCIDGREDTPIVLPLAADRAFLAFVSDGFKIEKVIGRALYLLTAPDHRIACGVIRAT